MNRSRPTAILLLCAACVILSLSSALTAADSIQRRSMTVAQLLNEAREKNDRGEHSQALAVLEYARAKDSENLDVMQLIGQLEAEYFTPTRGLAYLASVQRSDPDRPGVHMYLGKAYAELGMPNKALEHYNRALSIDGDSPKLAFWHGRALIDLGRYHAAEHALARVPAAGTPQSAQAQYELSILKLYSNDREAARHHIEAAAAAESDPKRRQIYLSQLVQTRDDAADPHGHAERTLTAWRAMTLQPAYAETRIPFATQSEDNWLSGTVYLGLEIDDNVGLIDDQLLPSNLSDNNDRAFVTMVYLSARLLQHEDWSFGLRTNLYSESHFRQEEADFAQLALSPFATWTQGDFSVDTHLLLSHSWAGGSDYEDYLGVGVTGEWRQADWTASSLYYRHSNREVDPSSVTPFTDRDGRIQTLGFSQSFYLMDLPVSLSLGFEHEWQNTDGNDYDRDAWVVYAGVSMPLPQDITLDVTYSHREDDYDNLNSASLFTVARDDQRETLSVRLTKPLADPLDLIFEYRYQDNHSNINQFDYTQNVYALGLRYSF